MVLLLLESAYDHFDLVLSSAQAGEPLDVSLSALAGALRLPPVFAESYFVVVSQDSRTISRFPLTRAVPGPPAPGPWDQAVVPRAESTYTELGGLPEQTRVAGDRVPQRLLLPGAGPR